MDIRRVGQNDGQTQPETEFWINNCKQMVRINYTNSILMDYERQMKIRKQKRRTETDEQTSKQKVKQTNRHTDKQTNQSEKQKRVTLKVN